MKGNVQLSLIAEICELHAEIMGHARTTLDKAIRIGQLLTEQKAKLKHGNWLPWIDANLPFSVDTAGRYMTVFKRRNEIPQRAEFQLTDAYRLLAAPAEAEPELDLETQTVAESQSVECPRCHRSYDPAKWDKQGSGYDCPYCWRDSTAQPVKVCPPQYDLIKREVPHVANNSGENEWYTPLEYIEAARAAMGGIDLDPASCGFANETIQAKAFFDKDSDGRKQKWNGRVWLNPPYAQPLVAEFAEKAAAEYEAGNIRCACILVNNATETGWFQRMIECASILCFTKGRIRFIDKDGNPSGAPLQGQAIIYFGKSPERFEKEFQQFGWMARLT